jgi:hypothetical protein
MFIINQQMACHKIILHTWPILVGSLTKAKLWLNSKTISKGKENNLLQCG